MRRLALLLLVCLSLPALADDDGFKAGMFDPPRMAPAFTLDGSNGAPLKLESFRGKVVVLGFGYTHCQAVCPITLSKLAQVARQLGPAASGVQVIYVTVDPERDSVARLHEYLRHFNPAFLGGTGAPKTLEAMRSDYGVSAKKLVPEGQPLPAEYEVHHSSFIYLIDPSGKLRGLVPFGTPPEAMTHDIELLLSGK